MVNQYFVYYVFSFVMTHNDTQRDSDSRREMSFRSGGFRSPTDYGFVEGHVTGLQTSLKSFS